MIVSALDRNDTTEPVWDDVGLSGCDFRPHFSGDFHNLFTTIYPLESKAETEQLFLCAAKEIAGWILENRDRFGHEDRFQIIVGWPPDIRPTERQVIKTGGDIATINWLIENQKLFQVRDGWATSVF
jgi:hypothetical protein